MKNARFLLVSLLVAPAALLAAGCGGSSDSNGSGDIPDDAVAVVGDTPISLTEFNSMVEANKKQLKTQKQPVPKAGTPEYSALRQRILDFLVQRTEFEAKAKADLAIDVTDAQVDARLKQIKKQYFGGSETKYEAQIKKQGLTDEQVHADIRSQLLSEAIFKKVTTNVKVTDPEIAKYYKAHLASYKQPEKRDVRHILVKSKAQADDIEAQLKAGGDFAKLAKKYSTDTSSKVLGGVLSGGITRGQTVPPFDKAAFALKTNEISAPVHTQFGWHIIQPTSKVTPAHTPPLKEEKAAIESQLVQQKKSDVMSKWVEMVKKEFGTKSPTPRATGRPPPRPPPRTG